MNRKTVEYSCLFKNSADFLAQARQDTVKQLTVKYDSDISLLVSHIDAEKKSHDEAVAWTKDYYKMHEGLAENDKKVVDEISEKTIKRQKEWAENEKTLAQWRDESSPEKIKAIAEKMYPKYDSAIEVFRWIVNDNKEVTVIDGGLYAQSGNDKKQILKYNNTKQNFQVIASSREADVNTYIKTLQKYAFFKFITE